MWKGLWIMGKSPDCTLTVRPQGALGRDKTASYLHRSGAGARPRQDGLPLRPIRLSSSTSRSDNQIRTLTSSARA